MVRAGGESLARWGRGGMEAQTNERIWLHKQHVTIKLPATEFRQATFGHILLLCAGLSAEGVLQGLSGSWDPGMTSMQQGVTESQAICFKSIRKTRTVQMVSPLCEETRLSANTAIEELIVRRHRLKFLRSTFWEPFLAHSVRRDLVKLRNLRTIAMKGLGSQHLELVNPMLVISRGIRYLP
ncbi:hypothetical protein BJV78DRAFT_166494 [Lactifluus subvellereus]|nr:hypothetical protein BJV78DRAFT_166494 [Lactifluus subvellereus]